MNLSKQEKKYLGVIAVIVVGLFLMEYNRPQPINWSKTFSKSDKIPYGGELIYQLLPSLFDSGQFDYSRRTFYELREKGELSQYSAIIMINDELSFNDTEGAILAEWVKEGGTLFMAASALKNFGDSLHAEPQLPPYFSWTPTVTAGLDSGNVHHFANPGLYTEEGFIFRNGAAKHSFGNLDRDKHTVLAYDGDEMPTFIHTRLGNGEIYWHCNPLLFTNYNILLRNNHEYIAKSFSYLQLQQKILWDEYYKIGRVGSSTPLRVVLREPSLSWAWFVTLGSILAFVVFNVKRRQRVVPIVRSPENTTTEFAETIGRLYLQHRDHQGLAKKIQAHFKDYVRRKLYISLGNLTSDEEANRLAEKSGIDADWIKGLFKQFRVITGTRNPSDQMLVRLYNDVEQFYQATGIRKEG